MNCMHTPTIQNTHRPRLRALISGRLRIIAVAVAILAVTCFGDSIGLTQTRFGTQQPPKGIVIKPKSGTSAQIRSAKQGREKERIRAQLVISNKIRAQEGVPFFTLLMQMVDNYSRGNAPAGNMEQRVFAHLRKARRSTVQKMAAKWRSLPKQKKNFLAGPVLKARVFEARISPRLTDKTVVALLKSSYQSRIRRIPSTPIRKPFSNLPLRPVKPPKQAGPKSLKNSMIDFGMPTFFCLAQNPAGDIPTEARRIRRITASELYCRDETNPEPYVHDTTFLLSMVTFRDANGRWNVESHTSQSYRFDEDGVVRTLRGADAILLERPAGREAVGEVRIHVQAWEDDTDDFTWREAIYISHKIAQEVISIWLQAQYGVTVPPQAKEFMNDNVQGWTELVGRVDLIGSDDMIVRATGIRGGTGATNLTFTDLNNNRKREFYFSGLGGQYFLRAIRVDTIPAAVNGGRPRMLPR